MFKKSLLAIVAAATLFGFNTNTFAFSLDAVFFGQLLEPPTFEPPTFEPTMVY